MSAHLAALEADQFAKLSRGVRLTVELWSEERLRPCGPASPQARKPAAGKRRIAQVRNHPREWYGYIDKSDSYLNLTLKPPA